MPAPAPKPRPVGRPRKEDAVDTRGALLRSALDLFVEHGYGGTSVRMIAREAGLSDGGLYAHFASKRALYDELLTSSGPDFVQAVLAESWPERAAAPSSPESFLTEIVERMLTYWEQPQHRNFSRLLLREEIPGHPQIITTMMTTGADVIGPLFDEWARLGRLNAQTTARLADSRTSGADLVWELLAPLVLVRLVHLHGPEEMRSQGRRQAHAHLEFFLDAVVRG